MIIPHTRAEKIKSWVKDNVVLIVAFFAAAITSIIVPPDREYLGYFDFKTLACLFCVLAVVCALRNIRFFYTLAKAIVRKFKNALAFTKKIDALEYVDRHGYNRIATVRQIKNYI